MRVPQLLILTLLFFVFSLDCFSQTVLPRKRSKNFSWEESKQGKTYTVKFLYGLDTENIPQERMDSIVMDSIIKSKYQLKNILTFRPIEVMIFGKKNDLQVYVEYSGKNSYGVESIAKSYFNFKNEGDGSVQLIGNL
jgi:hypothetical protein